MGNNGKWEKYVKFGRKEYKAFGNLGIDGSVLIEHFNMAMSSRNSIPSALVYYEKKDKKYIPKIVIKIYNEYKTESIIGSEENNSVEYRLLPILKSKIIELKNELIKKKLSETSMYNRTTIILSETIKRIDYLIENKETFSNSYNIIDIKKELADEINNLKNKVLFIKNPYLDE